MPVVFREHAFIRMLHGTISHIVFGCSSCWNPPLLPRVPSLELWSSQLFCMHRCVGTRITDVAPIVTLEFTHSCKLQQLYNNNDTSISHATLYSRMHHIAVPILIYGFGKIFMDIRSSPISELEKGNSQRLVANIASNTRDSRGNWISLPIDRMMPPLVENSPNFCRMIIDRLRDISRKKSGKLLNPNRIKCRTVQSQQIFILNLFFSKWQCYHNLLYLLHLYLFFACFLCLSRLIIF